MKQKYLSITLLCPVLIWLFLTPSDSLAAEEISLLSSSLKMVWGLLVVLGILLIIYGLLRKRVQLFNGGGKGIIKIIESRHIMPRKSIFLIEVRGREFLLGAGNDRIELIADLGNNNVAEKDTFDEILERTGAS